VRHNPEVQQALHSYQLGLLRLPVAGRTGELLGRGTGSSLEFQEYREYMPGDDIRHLDWAAYGRSDSLMVRLYREEISPRTEILLDASRSMTTGGESKSLLARQLTALFALLSAGLGGRPDILPLDDARPLHTLRVDGIELLSELPFTGSLSLVELLNENLLNLKRQAVRIVISDFLFPHDPELLIKRLAAGSGALWIIQLLNAWEANPTPLGGRRLIDAENNSEADLILDRNTIIAYRERLARLQEELFRCCRRAHAPFVKLIAENGLDSLCRKELCTAGILRPA
jgi:uncharacterized protein (DUF58 family)